MKQVGRVTWKSRINFPDPLTTTSNHIYGEDERVLLKWLCAHCFCSQSGVQSKQELKGKFSQRMLINHFKVQSPRLCLEYLRYP